MKNVQCIQTINKNIKKSHVKVDEILSFKKIQKHSQDAPTIDQTSIKNRSQNEDRAWLCQIHTRSMREARREFWAEWFKHDLQVDLFFIDL